jgi:O-antigen ligase
MLNFYRKFRWRGNITVIFLDLGILFLGCVATLVIGNWVTLLSGLGKDPTLTGRTVIWSILFTKLQQRPLLGFGRGAFWLPQLPNGAEVGQALGYGYVVPHAHNGLIDIALDVGYIGLLLFLIIYFTAFFRALKRAYASKNPEDIWCLGFLIFLAMNNVTESFLLRLANIYWVFFVIIVLSLKQTRQP